MWCRRRIHTSARIQCKSLLSSLRRHQGVASVLTNFMIRDFPLHSPSVLPCFASGLTCSRLVDAMNTLLLDAYRLDSQSLLSCVHPSLAFSFACLCLAHATSIHLYTRSFSSLHSEKLDHTFASSALLFFLNQLYCLQFCQRIFPNDFSDIRLT